MSTFIKIGRKLMTKKIRALTAVIQNMHKAEFFAQRRADYIYIYRVFHDFRA